MATIILLIFIFYCLLIILRSINKIRKNKNLLDIKNSNENTTIPNKQDINKFKTDDLDNNSVINIGYSFTTRNINVPYSYNDPNHDIWLKEFYRKEDIEKGYTIAEWHCIKSFKCEFESHYKLNRKRFNIINGMPDPDDISGYNKIFPGEQLGCKCKITVVIR